MIIVCNKYLKNKVTHKNNHFTILQKRNGSIYYAGFLHNTPNYIGKRNRLTSITSAVLIGPDP